MLTMVYGPQASGKTRNRDKLAAHYGHTTIIDGISRQHRSRRFYDDSGKVHDALPQDALLLTTMTRDECFSFLKKHEASAPIISIRDALRQLEIEEGSNAS